MTHETPPVTAKPERIFFDPDQFPPALVRSAALVGGLHYTQVGEDSEWVVVLGHPTREEVEVFAPAIVAELDTDPELGPDYDDLNYTWARLLWQCPDHTKRDEDCMFCRCMEPGVWWLDWAVKKGSPADVNRAKPGYFPVAVWEV